MYITGSNFHFYQYDYLFMYVFIGYLPIYLHYIAKSFPSPAFTHMWTRMSSYSYSLWLKWRLPILCRLNSVNSPAKAFHSSRSIFVRSDTVVGREGLACSVCSNLSQRCYIRLRSGLCRPVKFFNTKFVPFVYWCTVLLEQASPILKLFL